MVEMVRIWSNSRSVGNIQVCGGVVWLQSLTHCFEVCPNLGAGAIHMCGCDMVLAYPTCMCKVTNEKARWRLFL